MKITELTAVTLGKKIKAKEITVAEAVSAVLEQIEAVEGDVHAYVTLKDKEKRVNRKCAADCTKQPIRTPPPYSPSVRTENSCFSQV